MNSSAASARDRAADFYKKGQYRSAISEYTNAIQEVGGSDTTGGEMIEDLAVLYSNRCACYLQLDDIPRALSDANDCVSIRPNWAKGLLRLGTCHYKSNKFNEALEVYRRVLRTDPSSQEAIKMIATIERQINVNNRNSYTGRDSSNNSNNATNDTYYANDVRNNPNSLPTWLSGLWNQISQFAQTSLASLLVKWNTATPQEKNTYMMLIFAGLGGLYWMYSRWSYNNSYYANDDYYQNNNYYSSYGRGLSMPAMIAILVAGYYIPPMLPDVLGPQHARPFFGMSWMTFMWLVRTIFGNGGGGGWGGFGGGYPRYGYGQRRRGFFG